MFPRGFWAESFASRMLKEIHGSRSFTARDWFFTFAEMIKTMIFPFRVTIQARSQNPKYSSCHDFRGLDFLLGETKDSHCRKCKENSSTIAFHCRTKRIWTILMLSCRASGEERRGNRSKSRNRNLLRYQNDSKWIVLEGQEKSFWTGKRLWFRDFGFFEVAGSPQKNYIADLFTTLARFPTFFTFFAHLGNSTKRYYTWSRSEGAIPGATPRCPDRTFP